MFRWQTSGWQGWRKLLSEAGNLLQPLKRVATSLRGQLSIALIAVWVFVQVPFEPLRHFGLLLLFAIYILAYRQLNARFLAKHGLVGCLRWWAIYTLLLTPFVAAVSALILLSSGVPITAKHVGWWLLLGLFAGWVAKLFHALLEAAEGKL